MTLTLSCHPTSNAEAKPSIEARWGPESKQPCGLITSHGKLVPLHGETNFSTADPPTTPSQSSHHEKGPGRRAVFADRYRACEIGPAQNIAGSRWSVGADKGAVRILTCGPLDTPARARMNALLNRGCAVAHVEDFSPNQRLVATHDVIVVEGATVAEQLASAVTRLSARADIPIFVVFAPSRRPIREQRSAFCAIGADDALPATSSLADHLFRIEALLRREAAPSLLLVKNDPVAGHRAQEALLADGWDVTLTNALGPAYDAYTAGPIDAVVMDQALADGSGLSFLKALRSAGAMTPVLLQTRHTGREQRLAALMVGADDYAECPLDEEELQLRAKRLMQCRGAGRRITFGALELWLDDEMVRHRTQRVKLRPREYEMLAYLARVAGTTVPRHILLEDVWSSAAGPDAASAVAVTKSRLARALRMADVPDIVISDSGGYRFDPAPLRRAALRAPVPAVIDTLETVSAVAQWAWTKPGSCDERSTKRVASAAATILRPISS